MLSKIISDYTVGLKYTDLPPDVITMAKVAIMDWLGSVLGGSLEPPAQMIANVVRSEGGSPQATLIGFNEKSSVSRAALVNGSACHILELDDLHKSSIMHPAAPIISAAVAMAEKEGSTGEELITSVVAGFEVGIRIAESMTPSHYYYWHTTGTCGTFGATIAAAKIAKLTGEEIVDALGSAGSQAAGLWEFLRDGAMTKHIHPGKAAMNGILAVLLAKEGFTGAKRILEGEKGYIRATSTKFDLDKVTFGLGEEYRILGNSYKLYPSCRHTHGGVDLALQLVEEGLDPADVAKVVVRTYSIAVDLVSNATPTTPYEAKFSLPFCMASALLNQKLVLSSFAPERIDDPPTRELMGLFHVEADPSIDNLYPTKWPSEVEVTLKSGKHLRSRTDFPKGDPENPPTAEELNQKFKELAMLRWEEDAVTQTAQALHNLEEVKDLRQLFYQNLQT
jgi:2-methylcitrate dehydratase PrpD